MATIVKKILANTQTTLFTGKGINSTDQSDILRMNINSVIVTGAGDGTITFTLEAFDAKSATNKSITLIADVPTHAGTLHDMIPRKLGFTDSYSVKALSTSNCTIMLDTETIEDAKFVTDFQANNES